jgi:CheY-like chemotaxis protein
MVDAELAKDGFELEFAFDGDAALTHYLQQHFYDLVLTDLYHFGMNGVELARAIRQENSMQSLAAFSAGISPITQDPTIELSGKCEFLRGAS